MILEKIENKGKELLQEVLDGLPELEDGKNVCLALSGGLDSTLLLYVLVKKYGVYRVKTLSFDYGQRHVVELEKAKTTADRLGVFHQLIDLKYLGELVKNTCSLIQESELKPKTAEENSGVPQVSTYVPQRNSIFAFNTAAFAEANNCRYIFQALNATDEYSYPDNGSHYVSLINNVLRVNRENLIEFLTPFVEMYKEDELLIAKEISTEIEYYINQDMWSCYNGDGGSGKHCGVCNTDSELLSGYVNAGYSDKEILDIFNISDDKLKELRKNLG